MRADGKLQPGVRGGERELRVLAVIDALVEGGTERSLADLVLALRGNGVDFTIAILRSRGDEGLAPMLRDRGVDVRLLPSSGRVRALRRLVDEVRPDVVHSMLYESNLLARRALVGKHVPLMTSLVSTSYSAERRATSGVTPAKLRVVQLIDAISGKLGVDAYHAVSEAARDDAIEHLRVRRDAISVVKRGRPDPLPLLDPNVGANVRASLGIPADDIVVANVGRQERSKDQVTLIRALEPLLRARDDIWLIVAGRAGTATSAIEEAIESLDRPDHVKLLGHRGDIADVLDASDVFVLSSRYEGLPGSVIEAMAIGVPVVASDIGPVREVVEEDVSAVLCSPGEPDSFTVAIRRLIDDEPLRQRLGRCGRRRFEREFRIESSAGGMKTLYEAVAAAGPRSFRSI
ncbi:glycosyltransferase [Ilumatobacter nonamiensis]|uniref:glycosyltransferase n=1 Tax=Ilumatobacter nonamiensis TaxID=467093 RepID=UPI00130D657C|nr:glycosyltransferase [Ilumatobacter nonamiensis]